LPREDRHPPTRRVAYERCSAEPSRRSMNQKAPLGRAASTGLAAGVRRARLCGDRGRCVDSVRAMESRDVERSPRGPSSPASDSPSRSASDPVSGVQLDDSHKGRERRPLREGRPRSSVPLREEVKHQGGRQTLGHVGLATVIVPWRRSGLSTSTSHSSTRPVRRRRSAAVDYRLPRADRHGGRARRVGRKS